MSDIRLQGALYLLTLLLVVPIADADSEVDPFDVTSRCARESQVTCLGQCDDGWGSDCYYDSRSLTITPEAPLRNPKKECLAYYDMSVCEPCKKDFFLNGSPVRCEEFYAALNAFNKECKGCLKKRSRMGA